MLDLQDKCDDDTYTLHLGLHVKQPEADVPQSKGPYKTSMFKAFLSSKNKEKNTFDLWGGHESQDVKITFLKTHHINQEVVLVSNVKM